jgi:secreted trypsin-like serine protease
MKIKRWIHDGHDALSKSVTDEDELLEAAADALNSACSWDIMGPILFEADDGKFYVGTVSFDISEAHPDYVKAELEELEG